jgi:hypothetical protein
LYGWPCCLLAVCLHSECLLCGSSNTPPCTNSSSPLFTISFRYISEALLVAPLRSNLCLARFCWWLDSAVTCSGSTWQRLGSDLQRVVGRPSVHNNAACYTIHAMQRATLLGRGCTTMQRATLLGYRCTTMQRATLLGRGCTTMQRATLLGRGCTTMQRATLLGRGCTTMQRATPVLGRVLCYTFAMLISGPRCLVACLFHSLMFQQCTNLFFYFRLLGSPRTDHHDHWTYSCCC